jgi:hypothetical protein
VPANDGASIAETVARMRERMPGFRWDRFPGPLAAADLPRLITVGTIVDYLEKRGVGSGPETPGTARP